MPTYRPFVVHIGQPVDGAYPLTADFQGLQAHSSIPTDVLRQCLVDYTGSGSPDSRFGSRLFAALFTGEVLRLYDTARSWLGRDERLRIVLAQPLPEPLARLPWELVFDAPSRPSSLAAAENAPLVRYAPGEALPHRLPDRETMHVLVVVALPPTAGPPVGSPSSAEAADLARGLGLRDVFRRLAADVRSGAFGEAGRWIFKGRRHRVTVLEMPTPGALREHMEVAERGGEGYHLVHFFGQATSGGILMPAGDGGWTALTAAGLVSLVATESVAVFVLTLCQDAAAGAIVEGVAEEATRRGIPAAIGMETPVFDRAIVDYSREFYRALATGEPIELALAYGRRLAGQLHGSDSAPTLPALYMAHTGGLALPSLRRLPLLPKAWRVVSWLLATAFAIVGTTSGILDLPSFPAMLRDRAPVVRCVFPNPMDANKLTIAFLPLTVVGENGAILPSSAGHDVAGFLYQRFQPALARLELDMPYEVRSPARACALPGRSAEARSAAAAEMAQRLNADILVYGVITDTQKSDRLALSFNIALAGSDEEEDLAGPHALGGPLPVTLPFDPEPLLAVENPPHLVRMNVLAELVVGMSYLSTDNPERALEYIRQAEGDSHWPNVDGKELAYLLLGHALVRQASLTGGGETLQLAVDAYETALDINPKYLRAQLGRGAALAMLSVSERGADGRRRLDRQRLDQAAAAYNAVIEGGQPATTREQVTAHSGLGYVYLTSGLYGQPEDFERARSEFLGVVRRYEAGDQSLAKSAGQAYGYLALLDLQRGDLAQAQERYDRAAKLVAPATRAYYLYRLGELACGRADATAAIELYGRAIDDARLYGRAAEVDDYTARLAGVQANGCP